MRYLIVLLVVLSFVASFGVLRVASADTVGAGQFGITAGGTANWFGSGVDLGLEYGLSDYLSISLASDYSNQPYTGSRDFRGVSLGCNLKSSYDFDDSPLSIALSLGGGIYDQRIGRPESVRYEMGFFGRGNFAFQAWFVYAGLSYILDFDDGDFMPNPSPALGFDIEFNETFNMLVELGLPYLSLGLEFTF